MNKYDPANMTREAQYARTDEEIRGVWRNVEDKYKAGRMTESEWKEWELNRRIAAASEQTADESRRAARIEARAEQLRNDLIRNSIVRGQTEDQYQEETWSKQAQYQKFDQVAWKQALDEAKRGEV